MADIDDILAQKPDILVVGMGKPGRMQTSESLRAFLADARIELIEEPSAVAVHTFNRLHRSVSFRQVCACEFFLGTGGRQTEQGVRGCGRA